MIVAESAHGLWFGVFVVGHRDTEYRGVVYNNVVI